MSDPTYNTAEGIAASLVSLSAFLALCDARRTAGYVHGERMAEFVVLGRYWLDTCGNLMIADAAIPNMPPVVTREDFWLLVPPDTQVTTSLRRLPRATDTCPECKRGWTLGNVHDSVYRYAAGDEPEHFAHPTCVRARLAREHEAYFKSALADAGFQFVKLASRPNGYMEHPTAPPWFEARTEIGKIVLGWRKRVVNVDWSDASKVDLFPGCDDTHGSGYRHAWTRDSLVDVLGAVRRAHV
jgi:hypothetical protein